jgi:hypothetical protein
MRFPKFRRRVRGSHADVMKITTGPMKKLPKANALTECIYAENCFVAAHPLPQEPKNALTLQLPA